MNSDLGVRHDVVDLLGSGGDGGAEDDVQHGQQDDARYGEGGHGSCGFSSSLRRGVESQPTTARCVAVLSWRWAAAA